jgi:hypothetical protein
MTQRGTTNRPSAAEHTRQAATAQPSGGHDVSKATQHRNTIRAALAHTGAAPLGGGRRTVLPAWSSPTMSTLISGFENTQWKNPESNENCKQARHRGAVGAAAPRTARRAERQKKDMPHHCTVVCK